MIMNSKESTTGRTLQEIVQREKARLRKLLQEGLHPIYEGKFEDFLCDFYPDFSWNAVLYDELQACLDDPEWIVLAVEVKQKWGFDFRKDMQEGVDRHAEGLE